MGLIAPFLSVSGTFARLTDGARTDGGGIGTGSLGGGRDRDRGSNSGGTDKILLGIEATTSWQGMPGRAIVFCTEIPAGARSGIGGVLSPRIFGGGSRRQQGRNRRGRRTRRRRTRRRGGRSFTGVSRGGGHTGVVVDLVDATDNGGKVIINSVMELHEWFRHRDTIDEGVQEGVQLPLPKSRPMVIVGRIQATAMKPFH